MRVQFRRLSLFASLALFFSLAIAHAQNIGIAGGTLSWTTTESTESCGENESFTIWQFSGFQFDDGGSYPINTSAAYIVDQYSGQNGNCPAGGPQPSVLAITVPSGTDLGCTIEFTPQQGGSGSGTLNCSSQPKQGPPPIAVKSSTPGLDYFGFYDSSSPGFPDETQSIATFANTVWIGCSSPSECDARLKEAEYFKMHAIVAWNDGAIPASAAQSDVAAWIANWNTYTSTFSPYVTDGTIAAFYPYDEPIGAYLPDATLSDGLDEVANIIHGTFPTSRVAMVFTGEDTFTYFQHGINPIPPHFDWIGIDIYGCYSACDYPPDGYSVINEGYPWYYQTLESNLYPNQRVMLLPGTSIYFGGSYTSYQSKGFGSYLPSNVSYVNSILSLAEANSNVIGVFGFEYQNYYENASLSSDPSGIWVGPNDPSMSTMLAPLVKFGQNTVKRSFTRPTEPAGIVTGEPVELFNPTSGKCLDITGVSTTVGTGMQLYSCLGSGELNQMWKLYKVPSGTYAGQYQIISQSNNFYEKPMCLDLSTGASTANKTTGCLPGGTASGSTVLQCSCAAAGTTTDQLWKLVPTGSGYDVVSSTSANCLSVYGNETTNGAEVYTYQCYGTADPSQIFTLNPPALLPTTSEAPNPLF